VNPVPWDKASIAQLAFRLANGLLTDFAGYPSKDDLYRSVEAMGNSPDPEVRGYVMNILFRLDPEQAFSFLTRCLADPDEYVREGAVDLLGGYGERITPFLIPLLQSDPCPDVRIGAAAMLGYSGTQEAIPALKVAAEHDHAVDFLDENQVSDVAKHAVKQIKARYREGGNPNRYRDVTSLADEQRIEEQERLD
jgi:HEAT repeat protein